MGMAAGPSHDRTDSDSNGGATTSDTVDMDVAEEDSRMASASEHAGSGMGGAVGGGTGGAGGGGAGSRALVQTDENLLEQQEHGGENGGGVGGAGQEAEEQGDDNDNAESADSGDAEEEAGDADGDGGGRVSVGPAAALLGALGGGGGGASTGHMERGSAGKGSPADKVRTGLCMLQCLSCSKAEDCLSYSKGAEDC